MTRRERNQRASLPVNRVPVSRNSVPNADSSIPLHLSALDSPVLPGGNGARRGRVKNRVGMWGTLSQNYRTAVTIDKSWDATASTHGTV